VITREIWSQHPPYTTPSVRVAISFVRSWSCDLGGAEGLPSGRCGECSHAYPSSAYVHTCMRSGARGGSQVTPGCRGWRALCGWTPLAQAQHTDEPFFARDL